MRGFRASRIGHSALSARGLASRHDGFWTGPNKPDRWPDWVANGARVGQSRCRTETRSTSSASASGRAKPTASSRVKTKISLTGFDVEQPFRIAMVDVAAPDSFNVRRRRGAAFRKASRGSGPCSRTRTGSATRSRAQARPKRPNRRPPGSGEFAARRFEAQRPQMRHRRRVAEAAKGHLQGPCADARG